MPCSGRTSRNEDGVNDMHRLESASIAVVVLVVALNYGCSDPSTAAPDAVVDAVEDTTDPETIAADTVASTDPIHVDEATDDVSVVDPWADLEGTGPLIGDMIGVSTHMRQSAGDDAKRAFEFETYSAWGGTRIRQDYHWHRIEPNDDEWHFEAVQTQVDMAREADVEIVALLAYGVSWAMDGDSEDTIDAAEYGEFAGRVAQELCDDVKAYEVWNEENAKRFWDPAPNPAHYGDLLKAGYTAVKEACPDAVVLFGGLSSYDMTNTFDRWWFLREVHEAHPDIADYFDILALHPYTFLQFPAPEQDDTRSEAFLREGQSMMTEVARRYLADMGAENMPIWFTELGWPSYELTEARVGQFAPRSLLLAARDGVETWFWYTFWDAEPTTEGMRPHEAYFGLFGWAGDDGLERRPKPAFHAVSAAVALLGAARFARDISTALGLPNDVYALVFVTESDALTLALWDGRDFPDLRPDGIDAGGADTTHELVLTLPESATGAVLYDLEGAEIERLDADSPLELVLTPSVQYLALE